MGEEQGLSAENRATLERLGLFITHWIDMPINPHAEIGRITHQMLGQIMDAARAEGATFTGGTSLSSAARSEGLQPPVGDGRDDV